MIDLKALRENPDRFRRGAVSKRYDPQAVDQALDADRRRVEAQQTYDGLRAEQNTAGKEIGRLPPDARAAAAARLGELKSRVKDAEDRQKNAEAELHAALLTIPLPPDPDVPEGLDESQNVVLRTWGEPRTFDFKPRSHVELAASLGLADFQAGVRLAGTRSYILKGIGAELHQAVLRFASDLMVRRHGFTAVTVPVLVREEALVGTGFFPAGRESVYHVGPGSDDLFLVGTGEVGLTAMHADDTLDVSRLPLKYATLSTCFRREAGAYGKDTTGFYRVHQFDKVEQVVICRADEAESRRWHREMLGYSEQLLQALNLPYRVIQCCTGDLGVKNADMLDVETFMPSRVRNGDASTGYGETHSASRLYDFQARRLNLRYRDEDGQIRFCHTLNNTVAASPRILIPVLENGQNADGSVTIPEPLRAYMGGRERIGT